MTQSPRNAPPLAQGTVVNDRYEIRQSLGKGGMGEVFLAYDRSTQQPVALKVVREESRMPGDDEALRQELLLARSVSHPNVCRVHDLAPSPWGPILVMEHIAGQTLHTHIRRRKAQGGYTADEFRKIASEASAGSRRHPRPRSRPRRPEAGQRDGHRRPRHHPGLRLRPGARAPLGAPARAHRPTAGRRTTCRPSACAPAARARKTTCTRSASRSGRCGPAAFPSRATGRARSRCARRSCSTCRRACPSTRSSRSIRCLSEDANDAPPGTPPAVLQSRRRSPRARSRSRAIGSIPGPPLGRQGAESFMPGAQALLLTFATNASDAAGNPVLPRQAADDHRAARATRIWFCPRRRSPVRTRCSAGKRAPG